MNIFWTHLTLTTLFLLQGIQAQIRILMTAEENSGDKDERQIELGCRVTDTLDVHVECQELWWSQETDHSSHKEIVIGHKKHKSFTTGYQTKLTVHQPQKQHQGVYRCHALCGQQTFTATCHLKDLKNSRIECSSHFMNSYQKLNNLKSETDEVHQMKTMLAIGTPLFGIMLLTLLIMGGSKIWKRCQNGEAPISELKEIISDDDSSNDSKDKKPNEAETPKMAEEKPSVVYPNRPSIMLNGKLILDGDTPFAKVSYKTTHKPVISYVQDVDALQNWDPGVSCSSLDKSWDSGDDDEEENIEREKLLVPDNDCYSRDRSASCPEVPASASSS